MDAAPIDIGGSPSGDVSRGILQPKFCRRCGVPLVPETVECPACSRPAEAEWKDVARTAEDPGASQGSLRSSLALYFALLLTTLVAFLARSKGAEGQLVETAVASVIILVWALASWRAVFPYLARPPRPFWLLAGVGLAFLTFALSSLLVNVLTDVLGAQALEYTAPFLEAGYAPWVIILAICVQPAICEEIAFRGVILSGLRGSLGQGEALVVSALLFTTLHLAVLSFPHLFLLGILLGYLRLRSGSLYPSMALHFTHNLLCVLSELASA
jgi:CAAX protease family protein